MQTTHFSLEQVASTFNDWRSNKLSKFEPVPDSLKQLVKQLMPLYSKMQIIGALGVSYRFLRTLDAPVKRKHARPKRSYSNQDCNSDLQFVNFRISDISDSTIGCKRDASHNNICSIIKPNGTKLILHYAQDSSIASIIGAFLCSN